MQVAINLTPVLITLIICVTLCVICKMGKQGEGEKKASNTPEVINFKQATEKGEKR